MRRLLFSLWYWAPRPPPWDTGVTPPELERFVGSHPPGRTLDLGCGTGTNVVYLARHGWTAVGVDFAARAVAKARRRARDAEVSATFVVGDVTRLDTAGPFDLALDIGCLHSINVGGRAGYAAGLARVVRSGGTFLLYAFAPGGPAVGLSAEDVRATFASAFDIVGVEEGKGRPSAWYTLVRR
jgi:SAM-dependent methyltransferase